MVEALVTRIESFIGVGFPRLEVQTWDDGRGLSNRSSWYASKLGSIRKGGLLHFRDRATDLSADLLHLGKIQGEAFDLGKNVPEPNGFEPWRRLCNRFDARTLGMRVAFDSMMRKCWQGSSRVLVNKVHSIHAIHMMSQARSSCSALSFHFWWSTVFSSSCTSPSTTSSVSPCLNPNCAKIHQQEDYGCIAPYAPPTGYDPNRSTLLKSSTNTPQFFHSSDTYVLCSIDDEGNESVPYWNRRWAYQKRTCLTLGRTGERRRSRLGTHLSLERREVRQNVLNRFQQ